MHQLLEKQSFSKKISTESKVILSPILPECQGLLLFKEILIARAFPMMQLFIKPQYRTISYKVHVTLPHNLQKIADTAQK